MQNRRIAARGIIVHDGKLLLLKLNGYKDSIVLESEYWCTPGGTLELGEKIVDCLNRELFEELGVEPDIGDLLYVQQFTHNGDEHLEFFFHIKNTEDYKNIDLSKTTHGVEEINQIAFIDPSTEKVLPQLLQEVNLHDIKPSGNKVQFFSYL